MPIDKAILESANAFAKSAIKEDFNNMFGMQRTNAEQTLYGSDKKSGMAQQLLELQPYDGIELFGKIASVYIQNTRPGTNSGVNSLIGAYAVAFRHKVILELAHESAIDVFKSGIATMEAYADADEKKGESESAQAYRTAIEEAKRLLLGTGSTYNPGISTNLRNSTSPFRAATFLRTATAVRGSEHLKELLDIYVKKFKSSITESATQAHDTDLLQALADVSAAGSNIYLF